VNLDQYPFTSNREFLEFTFYSEGPHGNIEKRIRFKKIYGHRSVYNLAFGDLDPATGEISDSITTDNKDTDKVLATVASAVTAFFGQYPDTMVVAEGSTLSRTRLYRMRIAANLTEIQEEFQIYGLLEEGWELFVRNKPYLALLVERI
jgi:hypothetical protein